MKKHRKVITFLKQKSYLLAAVLMLAAVFGMTGVYVSEQRSEKKQQEEQARLEQEQRELAEQEEREQESAAVDHVIKPGSDDFLDAPDVISSKDEEAPQETVPEEKPEDAAQETPAQETASSQVQQELHFDAADEMGWPLSGNVIKMCIRDRYYTI